MKCIKACPASALLGEGRIDKKKCGDAIFATGFRAWRDFLERITGAPFEEKQKLLDSQMCMDLWQNFMTGNYYSCFVCQAVCDKKK
jgi:epoxyqueuosine reductase QueG